MNENTAENPPRPTFKTHDYIEGVTLVQYQKGKGELLPNGKEDKLRTTVPAVLVTLEGQVATIKSCGPGRPQLLAGVEYSENPTDKPRWFWL